MPLCYRYGRTFTGIALSVWAITVFSFSQNASNAATPPPTPKHFDHVLVVVLENQNYESAIKNDLLKSLAQRGRKLQQFRQPLSLLVSKLLGDDSRKRFRYAQTTTLE